MQEVYIVSYSRTALGRFGGAFKDVSAIQLGAHAIRSCLEKAAISAPQLDFYIFGNVLRAGHGMLIARQCALEAGIPASIVGYSLDMVCASGMMSILNAAMMIQSEEADLVLAGGVESMSQAAFTISHRARFGYKLLNRSAQVHDIIIQDGLTDPITGESMGIQAERLAKKHRITREEADQAAYQSQHKAAQALTRGHFHTEISPFPLTPKEALTQDEGIRLNTNLQELSKLSPVFSKNGILTAGNSSQISDGAAAILLASKRALKRYQLRAEAQYIAASWAGKTGYRFIESPISAIQKLLKRTRKNIDSIDLFENNEAFAINNILLQRRLGIPAEKLNIYGGAIALGHPLGCSGVRIVGTLINALRHNKKHTGIASICHGTGGGTALLLEV